MKWRLVFSAENILVTEDLVKKKQIKPEDYIEAIEDVYLQDKKNRPTSTLIFKQGERYKVLDYYQRTDVLGLIVQSLLGPWGVSFGEKGIAQRFMWESLTESEAMGKEMEEEHLEYPKLIFQYLVSHEGRIIKEKDLLQQIARSFPGKNVKGQVQKALVDMFAQGLLEEMGESILLTEQGRTFFS